MRLGKNSGFTLIEVIVVLVITASIGLAVYTTFAQGVRLWTRASKDRIEWRMDLFGEQMIEGLRNAFRDPKWPFRGTSKELLMASRDLQGESGLSKGKPAYFRYTYEAAAKAIGLQQFVLEDILAARAMSRKSAVLLQGVLSLEFQFYGYDARAKVYRWHSQWNKDCFPETVKITIHHEQMDQRAWTRLIRMPLHGACPE